MGSKLSIKEIGCLTEITIKSRTYGTHVVTIDTEDLPRIDGYGLCLLRHGKTNFQVHVVKGAAKVKGNLILLHRLLTNASAREVVDHINHQPLDNRKVNLRLCTQQLNMENRRGATKVSTSGVRGVYWYKDREQWSAQAAQHGIKAHLGFFASKEEAEEVVSAWRREHMTFSEMDKGAV